MEPAAAGVSVRAAAGVSVPVATGVSVRAATGVSVPTTTRVDVAVIGGGIAGLSCAYFLAKAGASVVVLEQESDLGFHSTGRSAATMVPGYGGPENDELTAAGFGFFANHADGLADHSLLNPRDLLWIELVNPAGSNADLAGSTSVDLDEALKLCPLLRREMLAAAAIQTGTADIDVEGLLQAFVRGAMRHGVVVHRSSEAVDLRKDGNDWRIRAGQHRVQSKAVVNASGAWADQVAARAGLTALGLRACKRTAFVSVVDADTAGLPLVLAADHSFYFRPDVPGVMLCSPADETESVPGNVKADEIDVAYAIDRINTYTTLQLRSVKRAWAGLRVFAEDNRPIVIGHAQDPSFVWCAGLGGTGIQTAPGVGKRVAGLVADVLR